MSIKRWIRNWLREDIKLNAGADVSTAPGLGEVRDNFSFSFVQAMNGMVIKVARYKPNPHGPDWTYELHIVKDDETIQDAVLRILAIYSLEK